MPTATESTIPTAKQRRPQHSMIWNGLHVGDQMRECFCCPCFVGQRDAGTASDLGLVGSTTVYICEILYCDAELYNVTQPLSALHFNSLKKLSQSVESASHFDIGLLDFFIFRLHLHRYFG